MRGDPSFLSVTSLAVLCVQGVIDSAVGDGSPAVDVVGVDPEQHCDAIGCVAGDLGGEATGVQSLRHRSAPQVVGRRARGYSGHLGYLRDVGWSLSYQSPREPELLDAALLAAEKALHVANRFEAKCKYVLTIANLGSVVRNDPVLSLTEAIAALPAGKMLAGTMRDLSDLLPGMTVGERSALESSRRGRNFIAHEGAGFGSVWAVSQESLGLHLRKLRAAVTDVAAGDNVVSGWVYEIEEKEHAPGFSRRRTRTWLINGSSGISDNWGLLGDDEA